MDPQYTPTYHRMWNRDFSLLIVAELLLCISCYMTFPFMPLHLFKNGYVDATSASMTMVFLVAGICVSGFFGCWLIQHYRRNKVFFTSSVCLAAAIFGMSAFDNPANHRATQGETLLLMCVCALGGIAFGNAKRVLSCTLLIDKTESSHRTEANYAAIWIARLMLVTGLIAALQLHKEVQGTLFYGIGAASALCSAILVMTVKFPFRAPEEGVRLISIDRFFLPQGWNVALVILLMSGALGIVMASHLSTEFLSSLAIGFAIAIAILRYHIVRTGHYTSAVGNMCILASILAMALHNGLLDDTLKPMVLGLGFGLTSSEQLYKLLDRCDHCQRSTAESTYFLASDSGLFLGISAAWSCGVCQSWLNADSEYTAVWLFAAATLVCSANALKKKRRPEHHAQ